MCPEGNDLSETYRKPAHVPGATAGSTAALPSPAGLQGTLRANRSPDALTGVRQPLHVAPCRQQQ